MEDTDETPEDKAARLQEEKEEAEFANFVKKHGLKAVYAELKQRLEEWKSTPLDIGVIGQSGSGKSSFINTIRRVKPTSPDGAAQGVLEKTKKPTAYGHPRNPMVKLWDLPGVGTTTFPRKSYLKQINFKKYDFFIVISHTRFTEDELWFANEITKARKCFYLIRTKIDVDVRNDEQDYPLKHKEDNVLTRIREHCIKELSDHGIAQPVVFLTCKNAAKYDFPKLEARLIADLPELKREAAVLTLRSTSKIVIKEKAALLQRRSWIAAAACVFSDSKPVQRLSIIVNVEKVSELLMHYKSVFGLDDDGLTELSESSNVPKEDLCRSIRKNFWLDFTDDILINAMASVIDGRTRSAKALTVPVIGFIFNSAPSYVATKLFLCQTITEMHSAMLNVLDTAFSKVSPKT